MPKKVPTRPNRVLCDHPRDAPAAATQDYICGDKWNGKSRSELKLVESESAGGGSKELLLAELDSSETTGAAFPSASLLPRKVWL